MSSPELQTVVKDNLMPNVVGMEVEAAELSIRAHATADVTFAISFAGGNGNPGTVKSTQPSATNSIPATVTLVVYGDGR